MVRDDVRMRFGITILPDRPWAEAAPLWRAAEDMGFDHGWTYDHLVWGGLGDSPWTSSTTFLTAAAGVTEKLRLGTFVASPNLRHPGAYLRDVAGMQDVSGGRLLLGLGSGAELDHQLLGGAEMTLKQRVDRFHEFVEVLDGACSAERFSYEGEWFSLGEIVTAPIVRPQFVVAANGPRTLRLAARRGDAWVTTGLHGDDEQQWWASLEKLSTQADEIFAKVGLPADFPRMVHLDPSSAFSLSSVAKFEDMAGRVGELGFTDVITHWPRESGAYAGRREVLEQVAADVLPRLR